MLQERQQSILGAVIREYIASARPVASRDLAEILDMDVSPATIRSELLRLDEQGYLEQPHTSAGRIPTDKGYRFFVDYLLTDEDLDHKEEAMMERVYAVSDADEFIRGFTKTVSQIAGAFAAAGTTKDDSFYESGFSEILGEPEFADQRRAQAFGRFADFFDEEIQEVLPYLDDKEEQIFIGRENPLKSARDCTMVLASWEHPAGFRGFISIVAPTRTDYQKHKAILRRITNKES